MTEEIIVYGVNVAGCEFYNKIDGICDNENNHNVCCGQYDTCTYKQLKRLEQENKELREKFNFMETANDIKKQDIDSLRDTNDKLRSALEEIKNLTKEISYLGSRGERELKFKIKNILEDVIDEEIY